MKKKVKVYSLLPIFTFGLLTTSPLSEGEILISFKNDLAKFEDLNVLNVGETTQLETTKDDLFFSVLDEDICSVDSTGLITAKKYGETVISASDGTNTTKLPIIINDSFMEGTISQENNLLKSQGDNNLYLYSADNGDFENDIVNGLNTLELYSETNYNSGENSWWNGVTFLNKDRGYTSGIGALSYKAPANGTYCLNYRAWLQTDIRVNSDYSTWDVDGFSTGIAKKDRDGVYSVLYSKVNDKMGVVNDLTRVAARSEIVDLLKDEEIMFFFMSNGNGGADEIHTDFAIEPIEVNAYLGTFDLPDNMEYIDEAASVLVNNEFLVTTNYEGLTYNSSNLDVATINNEGKVKALEVGTTLLSATDGNITASKLLVVKNSHDEYETLYSQESHLPGVQGENGMYIYTSSNGDVENDFVNGLNQLDLMDNNSFNNEQAWWNNTIFVNKERVFAGGMGAIAKEVEEDGNYRVDYHSYILNGVRKDPNYINYSDGYSIGIAKLSNGVYEVIESKVISALEASSSDKWLNVSEVTINAKKGDRILMFFASNGNRDGDEIATNFNVQRTYLENEEHPVYIDFKDVNTHLSVGSSLLLNPEILFYDNQEKIYSSSNENVIKVDSDGKVSALKFGYSIVTLRISKWSESLTLFVDGDFAYDRRIETTFTLEIENELLDNISLTMDGNVIGEKHYSITQGKITFTKEYMQSLTLGTKVLILNTEIGELKAILNINQSEEEKNPGNHNSSSSSPINNSSTSSNINSSLSETSLNSNSNNKEPNKNNQEIIVAAIGIVSIIGLAAFFIFRKREG